MVHRSKPELYASILRSANAYNGTGLTRLMDDSFMSHRQLTLNLKDMMQMGFLIYEPNIKRYRVTEKGLKFLALMDEMNDILKVEN